MQHAIGAEIGTYRSHTAFWGRDETVVVTNAEGTDITPSYVSFGSGGEVHAGEAARRAALINAESAVFPVKRFVGRTCEEVSETARKLQQTLESGPSDAVRFPLANGSVTPEEILAHLLCSMVEDAIGAPASEAGEAVVTVPACFGEIQRRAFLDACRIAGLRQVHLLNEPTAAALMRSVETEVHETALVYDLGGGFLDVSVVETGRGICEVRSSAGNSLLGGLDFDMVLVDWMAEQFRTQTGVDVQDERSSFLHLLEAAERARAELTGVAETHFCVPCVMALEDRVGHIEVTLTRRRLEELTAELVEKCMEPVDEALEAARMDETDIDEVILLGGAARMPAVRGALEKRLGRRIKMGLVPEPAVVRGAAMHAAASAGLKEELVVMDVAARTLGLEGADGILSALIPRNATLPARNETIYTTGRDYQDSLDFTVFEGENPTARDNPLLGHCRVRGIRPAPAGETQVRVLFDLDASGVLNVTAADAETGIGLEVDWMERVNLAPQEVEKLAGRIAGD